MQTSLAWKNLTHDRRRLAVALGGICFAVLLMFVQTGFQHALFDSQVKLVDDLDTEMADIIIVSKARYALPTGRRFPRERLLQAMAHEEVVAAWPIYLETEFGMLKKEGSAGHPIRVIGCTLDGPLFRSQIGGDTWHHLSRPNTALIDSGSKPDVYPFDFENTDSLRTTSAELMGRPIQLVGTFAMGRDFATEGNLLLSAANFASYFPSRSVGLDPLGIVDMAILDVKDPSASRRIAAELGSLLTDDVLILAREDFRAREVGFWSRNTPIGRVFALGTAMGFLVGMIICYQIIFSDISDHMAEFATLKAMGYTGGYFVRLILAEAFYLSLLGFIPGAIISWLIYQTISTQTGLLMSMLPISRVLWVLVLTMAMCAASGLLAMRKLLEADPADLF